MGPDLTKLPPAPWGVARDRETGWHFIPHVGGFPMLNPETECEADLEALHFAALARNALDVMLRREWWAVPFYRQEGLARSAPMVRWFRVAAHYALPSRLKNMEWPDPLTCLVEADQWLTEQEKNRGA